MKQLQRFVSAISLAFLLAVPRQVAADSVYRWVDEKGSVHYSSAAPSKDAKPAQLPKIAKVEMKIPQMKLLSCEGHGGINCRAGADADGSVICYDGFTGASPRYRFSCASAKLELASISEPDQDGGFQVMLRNVRGIQADKVQVTVRLENGKDVALEGPTSIDPSGTADFRYPIEKNRLPVFKKPDSGKIRISCGNCQ